MRPILPHILTVAVLLWAPTLWAQPAPPPPVSPTDIPQPHGASPADLEIQPLAALVTTSPRPAPTTLRTVSADASQPRVRTMTVFGTDPCPKSASADEIIVCAREPAEERYRIPTALRVGSGVKVSRFAKERKLLLGSVAGGAGGSVGSCSTVGPGGGTGCQLQANDAWKNGD